MDAITLILTGAADGLNDYTLRIKSLNTTVKNGSESRIRFNLPYISDYLSAYNARPSGDLKCYIGGVLWLTFNPENITFSRGAVNSTITISGTKQVTYVQQNTHDVSGRIISENQTTAGKNFKIAGFVFMYPNDIIEFNSRQIVIQEFSAQTTGTSIEFTAVQDREIFADSCYPNDDSFPNDGSFPCTGE